MKNRQPREVYIAIDNFISQNSVIDSDELTEFVAGIIQKPNYEDTVRAYARGLAGRRVKRKTDDDGLRGIFSNNDKVTPKYINVNRATVLELKDVQKAIVAQETQKVKIDKNIAKLNNCARIIEGQIALSETTTEKAEESAQN